MLFTERGRYGGFCLSTPLHAPRSPSTYTAVDVYSSTYHTAEHALVQTFFLCRAGMDVQHITCVGTGTVQGFPFLYGSPPSRGAIRPREANVQRSPLAELGTAPVMRRVQSRAAVWVGRGATARAREAEWSSRLAAVFWVCYNENVF